MSAEGKALDQFSVSADEILNRIIITDTKMNILLLSMDHYGPKLNLEPND